MIEYALLIMLGFCAAGLLALLIAPTIWNRAVRLTTKRLDATLPMSLSEIEADKDLLRASYALQIRRLEAGLNKARDKSASQLVDISRLQMTIGEMRDQIATLEKQLEERRNAANVFERTIKKRFPEMETALAAAKSALDERAYEIADLNNKLRRKDEALAIAQRSVSMQQAEIRKLRDTLERNSADRTGRFKKRPAQWTLEEFRSEYDRLNLEMSKMREQLALGHERETGQIIALKAELQNLAEQIMTSVAAQEKQAAAQRGAEAPAARDSAPRPRKRVAGDRPLAAPQPWPASKPAAPQTGSVRPAAQAAQKTSAPAAPAEPAPRSPVVNAPRETGRAEPGDATPRPAEARRASGADDASADATSEGSAALKVLLDRAAAAGAKPGAPAAAPSLAGGQASATAVADPVVETGPHGEAAKPAAARPVATAPGKSEPAAVQSAPKPGGSEPNLDRMLREIFESRSGAAVGAPGAEETKAPASPAQPEPVAAKTKTEPANAAAPGREPAEAEADAQTDETKSLVDRLRMV